MRSCSGITWIRSTLNGVDVITTNLVGWQARLFHALSLSFVVSTIGATPWTWLAISSYGSIETARIKTKYGHQYRPSLKSFIVFSSASHEMPKSNFNFRNEASGQTDAYFNRLIVWRQFLCKVRRLSSLCCAQHCSMKKWWQHERLKL